MAADATIKSNERVSEVKITHTVETKAETANYVVAAGRTLWAEGDAPGQIVRHGPGSEVEVIKSQGDQLMKTTHLQPIGSKEAPAPAIVPPPLRSDPGVTPSTVGTVQGSVASPAAQPSITPTPAPAVAPPRA